MARIRTIKPEFFTHFELYKLEEETGLPVRLAFAGLWTQSDREGRFKWVPEQLKLGCLPFDVVDFSKVMDLLADKKFLVRYEHDGKSYGFIPSWLEHQSINQREAQSRLPDPSQCAHMHARAQSNNVSKDSKGGYQWKNINADLRETVFARDNHICARCGATSDLTVDHIFPQSIGGTHELSNLRTLCRACNSARPVAGQALIDDLKIDGLTLEHMQRMCTHVQARGEGKGKEGKGREGNKEPPEKTGGASEEKNTKFEDRHQVAATRLSNPVKQRFPSQKIDLDKWAEDIEKIERIDGYPIDKLFDLWLWIQNHGDARFSWADQIRTPGKLRQRDKQGTKYLDVLTQQMQAKPGFISRDQARYQNNIEVLQRFVEGD